MICGSGGSEGSLKRRVWSHLGRWEMKNCMPFWREAHFQVKIYKAHQRRSTFGSWDVQKVHAVVARSTFPSQNAKSMATAERFWKVRCRKSARRCGAKHISKSGVLNTPGSEPLLEVEMLKKCTPLWREAHFRKNTPGSEHFWKLRCWKSARRCGAKHISRSGVWQLMGSEHFWKLRCWNVHGVVVRSTFGSEHAKSTTCSDHFWTFNRTTPHSTTTHYNHNCNHYNQLQMQLQL